MRYTFTDTPYPPFGSGLERSTDTIHLTDVIKYIQHTMGTGYKKGTWKADMYLTMDVGFMWEHALELAYADRMADRIGEVEYEGIVGSPDGFGWDKDIHNITGDRVWQGTGDLVLEEYKATWKSCNKPPTDNWAYMTQIKSYLKMMNLTVCIMHIVYLMGNYRGSGPQYRICRIEFEQHEIDENWRVIKDHARLMQRDKEYQEQLEAERETAKEDQEAEDTCVQEKEENTLRDMED